MTETDEQLMMRYCGGDAGAFDVLYRRYRGPLFRYLGRLAGPPADVESLYQDVWMRIIGARGQWRSGQPFRPWLYRIAHNRAIDFLRAQRGDLAEDVVPDELPQAGPGSEALHLLRDCVQRLLALLPALPEVQRSAFLLKEEGGLSLQEIGDVSGVSRETVKSRLRYALRRLREGLEGCDD